MAIVSMLPEEGAAVRIQLDAMLAVLAEADQEAAEVNDDPVRHLVASLYEARLAAVAIETRAQPRPVAQGRKGVRLAKR